MKSKDIILCEGLLQENGYRLTSGRMALLIFLKSRKKPLSVNDIQKEMKYSLDKVTLYRALEDFVISKIVAKIKLRDVVTYYEFIHKDHHHHHIICSQCGNIEDIENCNQEDLQNEVLKHSRNFSAIGSHSLEFFGVCKVCNK